MSAGDRGGGFVNTSTCISCGSLSFNSAWYNAFGIMLCEPCRRDEKLITKGQAKQAYLLTDKDISKLGTISKTNPQHKAWRPMQLYLQSQVEEVAQRKHGSVDQLEELRSDRLETRLQGRMVKRKAEQQEQEDLAGEDAEGSGQGGGAAPTRLTAMQRHVRGRLEDEYANRKPERAGPPGDGSGSSLGQGPLGDAEVEEI